MGTLGTFDSFTTARLGIYAAQHGLRVTGNNISNINTAGYTRQRVDQVSFKTGGNDRYASFLERHIGSGALISGINQIRDPYLDIRYRNTSSSTAYFDTKLSGLQEIASILDEVGKGGKDGDDTSKGDGLLYAQLQELMSQLRAYGASPTSDNNILVRGAAGTLVSMFQKYADRLEQVRLDTEEDLHENVTAANGILRNIRDLNKSIRDAELHGDKALELRDERNRQIDALSEYMHIKVEYTMEDVGAGIQVEKLTISLANDNPDPKVDTDTSVLVDGLYATQLSIPEEKPVLNEYLGSTEAGKEYLNSFLFLKEVTEDSDEAQKLLAANPGLTLLPALDKDGNQKQTADGKALFLLGTNDPAAEGILTRKNDNYTIQLGKLLDVNGNEWKNSKTTWERLNGDYDSQDSQKAVYNFVIGTDGSWQENDTFTIKFPDPVGVKTYTIGTDISLANANDPNRLAAFIATELGKDTERTKDYVITSNGSNIVFTAKKAGAVGAAGTDADGNPINQGPDAEPTLTLTPNTGKLTMTKGPTIDGKDSIPPKDPDPPTGTVTDPVTGSTVTTTYFETDGKWYKITMETQHTREVVLDDNDLYGSLQAQREMLTEEGEFSSADDITVDENAKTKRGIPYYQKSFDLLAQQIAKSFNELNQGYMLNHKGNYVDKNGKELELPGADGSGPFPVSKYDGLLPQQAQNLINNGYVLTDANGNKEADLNRWLEENGAVKMGGPLFSNRNDGNNTDGITASNIAISSGWSSGEWMVVPKFEVLFPDDKNPDGSIPDTTQPKNINHMISLMDAKLVYDPKDIDPDAVGANLFTGSFNDMFCNMMGVQAKDAKETNVALNNDYTTLVALDSSREGVSGVDLNDEAMNMMQYQKAMNAAMRLMTAIDEALDRLINNTGIAGR